MTSDPFRQPGDSITRPHRMRMIGAGLALAILSALTGCDVLGADDPYRASSDEATAEAAEQLRTLPTLEEAETELTQAVVQMSEAISSLVDGTTWHWTDDAMSGNCGRPYDRTDGNAVNLRNYVSDKPIPDEVWPEALRRIREIAGQHGATEMVQYSDLAGDHDVQIYGDNSIDVHFLTKAHTVIGAETGCRLPARFKTTPPPTTR